MRTPDGDADPDAGSDARIPQAPRPKLTDYFECSGDTGSKRPAIDPTVGRILHWIALERSRGNTNFVRDDRLHERELKSLIESDAAQSENMMRTMMEMTAASVVGDDRIVKTGNQEWSVRKACELRVNGFAAGDCLPRDQVFGPFFEAAEAVGRDKKWRQFGGGKLPPQAQWRRNPTLRPFIKLLEAVLFSVPSLALVRDKVIIDMLLLMTSIYSTDFVDQALEAFKAFEEDKQRVTSIRVKNRAALKGASLASADDVLNDTSADDVLNDT